MKRSTVVYFIDKKTNKTLMAWQQRKVIGLKGYGGVIEDNEDPRLSACREVWEESGGDPKRRIYHKEVGGITVKPENLEPVVLIDFYNGTEGEVPFGNPNFRVLGYRSFVWEGKAISTNEMVHPDWYGINQLPLDDMIIGDSLFIKDFFSGNLIMGYIRRTSDWKKIIDYKISPCTINDLVI